MRRLILLGGFALLLFNALAFLFFVKNREATGVKTPQASLSSLPAEKKKTLFVQKGSSSLKLSFNSGSSITALSSVEIELERGSYRISGRAPRGVLLGKKLTLLDFSGSACGWNFRAKKFVLFLDRPEFLNLTKYSFRKGKELFKGLSTSTFELDRLCGFLKKERKSPH